MADFGKALEIDPFIRPWLMTFSLSARLYSIDHRAVVVVIQAQGEEAFQDLTKVIRSVVVVPGGQVTADPDVDLDYLQEEIPKAIKQLLEGVQHVARIVGAIAPKLKRSVRVSSSSPRACSGDM